MLLTNSCARGKATPDSCLDLQVLVQTEQVNELDQAWRRYADNSNAIAELNAVGRWSDVHLDITDGAFEARPIDHELDLLEVQVGNLLAYSIPLFERGNRLHQLRTEWLPFYGDELRAARLAAASETCLGDLDRIPWFLDRQLWFHALARLHGAVRAPANPLRDSTSGESRTRREGRPRCPGRASSHLTAATSFGRATCANFVPSAQNERAEHGVDESAALTS